MHFISFYYKSLLILFLINFIHKKLLSIYPIITYIKNKKVKEKWKGNYSRFLLQTSIKPAETSDIVFIASA